MALCIHPQIVFSQLSLILIDALFSSSCFVSLRTVTILGTSAFACKHPDLIVYACIFDFEAFFSFLLYSLFCFVDNSNLVSVVLPTSLVAIPDYAFAACSALPTITIPT
jgi:hypothetical protein